MTIMRTAFEYSGKWRIYSQPLFSSFHNVIYPIRDKYYNFVDIFLSANASIWTSVKFCHLVKSEGEVFNPLPHMPILGSSISAANKDMMSILTNGDIIF